VGGVDHRDAKSRQLGECPHNYWHSSQCPFCEVDALKRDLFIARLKVAELQRAYDVMAGEASRLRNWRNTVIRTRARARKET
jgi:hypothetical protein